MDPATMALLSGASSALGGKNSAPGAPGGIPSLTSNARSEATATTGGQYGTGSFSVTMGGMSSWAWVAIAGLGALVVLVYMKGR